MSGFMIGLGLKMASHQHQLCCAGPDPMSTDPAASASAEPPYMADHDDRLSPAGMILHPTMKQQEMHAANSKKTTGMLAANACCLAGSFGHSQTPQSGHGDLI